MDNVVYLVKIKNKTRIQCTKCFFKEFYNNKTKKQELVLIDAVED